MIRKLLDAIYERGRATGLVVLLAGLALIGLGVWAIESSSPVGTCGVLALPLGLIIVYVGLVNTVFG